MSADGAWSANCRLRDRPGLPPPASKREARRWVRPGEYNAQPYGRSRLTFRIVVGLIGTVRAWRRTVSCRGGSIVAQPSCLYWRGHKKLTGNRETRRLRPRAHLVTRRRPAVEGWRLEVYRSAHA